MSKIVVIGLGPGDIGSLTLEAVEKITDGNKVFLRTQKHPTVEYLKSKQVEYTSFDYAYDENEDFNKVYEFISKNLIQMAQKCGIINYCVPGHPLVAEKTVSLLIEEQKKGNIELEIIAGLSFIEPVIIAVNSDPVNGLKIIDGLDIPNQSVDINTDNLITQVYNKFRASELKLELMDIYGDEYEVYVIKSAGIKGEEIKVKVPLYEIDRIEWIDYLTSIYIPKMCKSYKVKYDMHNLVSIMQKLRSEDGCAWDSKQTHSSLRTYIIEEAYEVVDAIDNDDIDEIVEELGDLLLQIVFHSQIGKEEGYFSLIDVSTSICQKLIRRHPHVFSDFKVKDSEEVLENWNDIKAKEKNINTYTDRLKSIPKGLPALMKSLKVQKRAADVGFDWEDVKGALEKLEEELKEVKVELKANNKDRLEDELGDLIFSIVNVCRFYDINPEISLNKTIDKFIKRFEFIESESIKQQKDMKKMTIEDMDALWNKAKIKKIKN